MKKKEEMFPLTKEQKAIATEKIKEYLRENFEIEAGKLQSEMFLDYISENFAVYYYNKAIADTLSFMADKVDELYLLMKDEVD